MTKQFEVLKRFCPLHSKNGVVLVLYSMFFYLAIFTVFTPNRRFLASFEVGISLPVSKRVQLDLNQCAHLLVNLVNGSTNRVLDELERDQKKENHLNIISKMMGT